METGALIFVTLVAVLGIAMLLLRFQEAITDIGLWLGLQRAEPERVNESNQSRTQIMSNDAPSVLSVPRDGAQNTAAVTPQLTYAPHVILDTLRDLRTHGFTRDQARVFTNRLQMPWKNELWSQVVTPSDDDLMVTPYAGRATKRSYYPDTPELEYQEP